MRERLDRIRSMMTYYQDATAFIHSGDEEGAEAGAEAAAGAGLNSPHPSKIPANARQRLLDYGSGSETSSQSGSGRPTLSWRERPSGRSAGVATAFRQTAPLALPPMGRNGASAVSSDSGSLNSEQLWAQHPQLVSRIRQLNSAKTRLNRLQTLIQAMETGVSVSSLPEELQQMAVELLGEEGIAGADAGQASSGQRALPPLSSSSRGNGRAEEVEAEDEDDPEALLSNYQVRNTAACMLLLTGRE